MISVVVPAYNEASNLPALWGRIQDVFKALAPEAFECVIVDDGSTDESPRVLEQLRRKDSRLHWVRLKKNSGSHEAIGVGLKTCRGEAAIVLAADLQDPPEVFRELISRWRSGHEVVWAVRTARPGETPANQLFSRLYYWIMNLILESKFPSMGADFFLADRKVLRALEKRYRRHSPNILFQVASLGFATAMIGYVKQKRYSGKSKWGFKKRLYLFIDSILVFSPPPALWMAGISFTILTIVLFVIRIYILAVASVALTVFYVWRCGKSIGDRSPIEFETSISENSQVHGTKESV